MHAPHVIEMKTRGQAAAEYAVVLAVIAAFVAGVALTGFREQELNMALAASRHATLEYVATQNSSLTLAGVDYDLASINTTIRPRLYDGTTLVANASTLPGLQYAVLNRIRRTLRPNSPLAPGNACVQAATATYCCCSQ